MMNEATTLAAVLILALVQIFAAAGARTRQYGSRWNMGARDEAMPPLDPLPARLLRAQANLFETLPLYVAALLGAMLIGHAGWRTELGGQLYLWGRVTHFILYAAGISVVRTLAFAVSLVGLLLLVAALLG